ncbi:MAG: protoheme IX farnesyltransferase [Verrucomicrobia bacterium]|nr:protoheme IX farnesyltransferase [Verrucomicrobiota bacterium]
MTDDAAPADKARSSVLTELFKARLTSLVLLTTLVGFYLGQRGGMNWLLLVNTLMGTGLLACGAAALNQYLERDFDALMERTEDRPLPAGLIQPQTVVVLGGVLSVAGLLWLAFGANLLTAVLGAVTLISYLFIYTPLKRKTTLNTAIGAIPGALPPLMGWTASRGDLSIEGWALFAILFFWQLPHFLAIAWMYREDYARGGFVMLPLVDRDGSRTGRSAVSHTLGLLPVSLSPFVFQMSGALYLSGALVLGLVFLWCAARFARQMDRPSARRLFFASILYLPLLLGLMVFDKQ